MIRKKYYSPWLVQKYGCSWHIELLGTSNRHAFTERLPIREVNSPCIADKARTGSKLVGALLSIQETHRNLLCWNTRSLLWTKSKRSDWNGPKLPRFLSIQLTSIRSRSLSRLFLWDWAAALHRKWIWLVDFQVNLFLLYDGYCISRLCIKYLRLNRLKARRAFELDLRYCFEFTDS